MTDQRSRLPISRPDFWAACFLDEYAYDVPGGDVDVSDEEYAPDLVVEYGGGGGYALLVSRTSYGVTLKLCHPGAAKPVELGWDDLAHWHPHALRWSEVDLVCRATALADPDAGYPGPHLALLGRFGPACTEADAAVAMPLLREAFTTLPGLDRYQRHTYASRGDIRAFGVRWTKDPTGWWYPCQGGDTSAESHDPYRDDPDAEDYLDGGLYSTREPGARPLRGPARTALAGRGACPGSGRYVRRPSLGRTPGGPDRGPAGRRLRGPGRAGRTGA
ncbi:hypothetical protein E1267_41335 [Nonomuraea longispora]|uniref:Uncharacterized protein n=1 Tax=Nonomuraea longispora TaxID=1848320 RepID=A0A4R4MJQ4_9ACTN|nr:hypothetical protein [Nonomuraea longispora]TDB96034.1 hypothetical protein E1267_41335 [Nonomuraea longispora]